MGGGCTVVIRVFFPPNGEGLHKGLCSDIVRGSYVLLPFLAWMLGSVSLKKV